MLLDQVVHLQLHVLLTVAQLPQLVEDGRQVFGRHVHSARNVVGVVGVVGRLVWLFGQRHFAFNVQQEFGVVAHKICVRKLQVVLVGLGPGQTGPFDWSHFAEAV